MPRNLIKNSSLALYTRGVATRVAINSPVVVTGYSNYALPTPQGAAVKFTCPSGTGGIVPGKMFLVEGPIAPHAPHVNFPMQVTNNRRFNAGPAPGVHGHTGQ